MMLRVLMFLLAHCPMFAGTTSGAAGVFIEHCVYRTLVLQGSHPVLQVC